MKELIERIEAASEGSRELDEAISAKVAGVRFQSVSTAGGGLRQFGYGLSTPDYTTSIDAALTLVPESCGWAVYEHGSAQVGRNTKQYFGDANTPALAICAAALKARETA